MKIKEVRPDPDDDCVWCGYPFDMDEEVQTCLIDEDTGELFCSLLCALETDRAGRRGARRTKK